MTQPAVSRQVSRLEVGLGVTLLRRTNRHVELTPEGRVFLTAARDVLVASRRAAETAQLAGRGGVGVIRVASAGTFPNELATRLVRAFRRDHSAVEVLLSQSSYISGPTGGIERHLVDVAVVRTPLAAPGLELKPLVHERRLLVVGRMHRLARRTSVAVGDLAGEPVVSSLHWPQRVRDYWAGVDDGADPAYAVSVLAGGPGEWLSAVGEGRGVSLCPASIANYYRRDDLAFLPVAGLAPNTIGLAWRRDNEGPLVRNFTACAEAYASDHSRTRSHPIARVHGAGSPGANHSRNFP
jgi:DNA-binding transcriptional LysR family regulator